MPKQNAIYEIVSTYSFQGIEDIFAQFPKNHPAQAPYGIFRLANRQIWGNIAIGLGNQLGVFQNELVSLFRGQDLLQLYKIIPEELPGFANLNPCRVVDYIPEWRRLEEATATQPKTEQAAKAVKAPPPEPVDFVTQM